MMTENNNSIRLALKETTIESKKIKVKQLIANGADLSESNEHHKTPLHVAISQGLEDVAAELITRMSVKMLNTLDGFGLTPLYLAIEKNRFETAQLMLKAGASVNVSSFVGNTHLVTSLQLALQLENYKMVNLLLEYEPEVFKIDAMELLKLPLQWVVKEDFRNIFKLMCKSGMPRKYFDKEIVFELLNLAKSPKMGEHLLKQFYRRDEEVNFENAIRYNMFGIIEYFVKNDASVINQINNFGGTYLHYAVSGDRHQVVELLIKLGFDANAKSTDNSTPLHIAVMYGLQKSAEILLENGANIDAQRFKEYTPLMTAIQYDRLSMVKFLIQKGASLTKRNNHNRLPLEMALKAKKFNIALMIPYLSGK